LAIIGVFVVALTTRPVLAQNFFGGGVVAYDPEISTVSSGVVMDVQPTVSYDNKYVTIGMQVQDSRLIALRNFQVASPIAAGPPQGFVGNATPTVLTPGGAAAPATPSNSPEEIERRAIAARSILSRRGMFLLRVN
jgi:hypothetical protein